MATKITYTLEIDDPGGYITDTALFKAACQESSQALNNPLNIQLMLVPEQTMFQMNNQMRAKPSATDVLSLPYSKYRGEIYICPEFILKTQPLMPRMCFLFVHGMLHIAGHTHDNDQDFERMRTLETQILTTINQPDPYDEKT